MGDPSATTLATTACADAADVGSLPRPSDQARRSNGEHSAVMRATTTTARKQKKVKNTVATRDDDWERCMFRVAHKQNRFCNRERVPGMMHCGHHLPKDAAATSRNSQQFRSDLRHRVSCPVDASHTVYAFDLQNHIKVCNKRKQAEAMRALPYYSKNINSGSHPLMNGEGGVDERLTAIDNAKEQSLINRLADVDFHLLVERINVAYAKCVGEIPIDKCSHPCCDDLLAEKAKAGASKKVLRHIEQQASIIAHMDRVHLLDPGFVFLELGAGRGLLSLALAQTLLTSSYILIDRATNRGSADHLIREGTAVNSGDQNERVTRLTVDIRHLKLSGINELTDKPIVGMSKHLCGVATDLSLRAMVNTAPIPTGLTRDAGRVSPLCKGIAVALCCHHVCQWEDYVNPEFIMKQGFQAHEFPLLTGMTSWATCAMQAEGDAVEAILGITKSERAILGRKCKRVLDAGRLEYLKNAGMQAELIHYCEVEDTVENCLLLGWQ